MRRQVFLNSVLRRLPPGHELVDAAYMWRRHPWALWYCLGVGLAAAVLAGALGFEWGPTVGIALAAAAIAATATTRYRVLALTDQGIVSLRASTLRQTAIGEAEVLPARVRIELAGNYWVYSEWSIDDVRWSVPRSSENAMTLLAAKPG